MQRHVVVVLLTLTPSLAAAPPEAEIVRYPTPDGVRIVADYYPPKAGVRKPAPVVIMLHQYPSTRSSWRPLAELFHEAGYAVLAPDLRGHGDSVEPKSMHLVKGKADRDPKHYKEAYQDVLGAYEWLRERDEVDRSRIALVGASIGCSVSLAYAATDPSVDVVACLSPGLDYFGVNSVRDIKNLDRRPVLLVSPKPEADSSRTLGKNAQKATVKVYEASDLHGTFMFGQVPGVEKLVLDFVDEHIGRPGGPRVVGSIKSTKYHKPDCRYAVPDPDNRYSVRKENLRVFSSPEEALGRGYTPCKRCFKGK